MNAMINIYSDMGGQVLMDAMIKTSSDTWGQVLMNSDDHHLLVSNKWGHVLKNIIITHPETSGALDPWICTWNFIELDVYPDSEPPSSFREKNPLKK